MKNISLYFILFFLSNILHGMDDSTMLTIIFAPAPLLDLHHKHQQEFSYLSFCKKATIPLTGCFYYGIKKNDVWTDIIKNPYTTSIITYIILHYCIYSITQNQQNKIDEEIINTMQHVFYLLIIGHGIYNKITNPSFFLHKISTTISTSNLMTLQLFLHKAYNAWFILFSYYQEHYKNKPLYAYHVNKIDLFDVLQASSHESDILPLITHFYDKNNIMHDYESILNCLEVKLKLINHKLIYILPTKYHHHDEK